MQDVYKRQYQMIQYYISQNAEEEESSEEETQQAPQDAGQMGAGMTMDENAMAEAMDTWLTETPDDEILLSIYEEYIDCLLYTSHPAYGSPLRCQRPTLRP